MATISTAQTILTSLETDLQLIKVVRGYLTNMGERVFRGVYAWDEVQSRPAVAFWEDTLTLIPEDRTIGTTDSQSQESLIVSLVVYADVDDNYDTLHKAIKDIRVFLLSSDNTYLCDLEEDDITIETHAGRKMSWALFQIRFQYYITSTNP